MPDTKSDPAIGISLSVAPSDGRSLVLQTHVGFDEDPAVLDRLIDQLYNAAERLVNRAAGQSLTMVLEKLEDDFEDQTRAYLVSAENVAAMETTFQSLVPGERERGTREGKKEMDELATKINAARESHRTYLSNKEQHEFTTARLRSKRDRHAALAK